MIWSLKSGDLLAEVHCRLPERWHAAIRKHGQDFLGRHSLVSLTMSWGRRQRRARRTQDCQNGLIPFTFRLSITLGLRRLRLQPDHGHQNWHGWRLKTALHRELQLWGRGATLTLSRTKNFRNSRLRKLGNPRYKSKNTNIYRQISRVDRLSPRLGNSEPRQQRCGRRKPLIRPHIRRAFDGFFFGF